MCVGKISVGDKFNMSGVKGSYDVFMSGGLVNGIIRLWWNEEYVFNVFKGFCYWVDIIVIFDMNWIIRK